MKILFCMTSYQVFKDRALPLALRLKEAGADVRVLVYAIDHTETDLPFPTTVSNWPWFDFADAITAFNPELLIVWNGKFPHIHAAVAALCASYPYLIMEMGWFPQKDYCYLADELAPDSQIAKILYKPDVASSEANQAKLAEARARYDLSLDVELPSEYVFVPMQLEYDTQITCHSEIYKSMNSLLGMIRRSFLARGLDVAIVCCNHPHSPNEERPGFVKNLTGKATSIALANRATFVAGINSTLLAEAVLFCKPVVGVGKSVAGSAFVNQKDLQDRPEHFPDLGGFVDELRFHGELPAFQKDICDYRALVLIENQWEFKNPPDWVIEKVLNKDLRRPRVPFS